MKNLLSFVFSIFFAATVLHAETKLRTGAPVEIFGDFALPRETVIFVFPGGAGLVPKPIQGVTQIVDTILSEGPVGMEPMEYQETLFRWNAEIGFLVGPRSFQVYVTAPKDNLVSAIRLAHRLIENPKLTDATYEISKAKVDSSAQFLTNNMSELTRFLAYRDFFGYSPDTMSGQGTPATMKNISLAIVKELYPKFFEKKYLWVMAATNLKQSEIADVVNAEFFPEKEQPKFETYVFSKAEPVKRGANDPLVTIIHKPKATDHQIWYLLPKQVPLEGKERITAQMAVKILGGGGLSSRLGKTLREQRGLTYYAGSFIHFNLPVWTVYTFGGTEQIFGLLKGIPEIVSKYRDESLKPKEIDEQIMLTSMDYRASTELPIERAREAVGDALYGRSAAFRNNYLKLVAEMKVKDVMAWKKANMVLSGGHYYLMGDESKLLPILEKLGIPRNKIQTVLISEVM